MKAFRASAIGVVLIVCISVAALAQGQPPIGIPVPPWEIKQIAPIDPSPPIQDVAPAQWQPPIGIPVPPWGITQVAPSDPSPWIQDVPGFYYVDSTVAAATDTNNPHGWPGQPRKTIPNIVPAGSVVELRGAYSRAHTSPYTLHLNGTSTAPVFVRGANSSSRPVVTAGWEISGTYFIVENITFACCGVAIIAPVNTGALRNSEVRGTLTSGGMFIGSWAYPAITTNFVVLGCVIHDNGDVNAAFDQDKHGIGIGWNGGADHIWILDSEFYRNSGDGIQIAAGNPTRQASVNHIYVGRNVSHHIKQSGFWSKQAVDVIFSQNVVYGHRRGNSSYGSGMGFQYAPERIWFLFNHIYDNDFGIGLSSDSGLGTGTNSYFVGNVIHNIHAFSGGFNPNSAWSNAAFMMAGGVNRWVVDNTVYDIEGGINLPGGGNVYAANNIIAGLSAAGGRHIFLESVNSTAASTLKNTLIGEAPRLSWGSAATFTSVSSFQSATGKGLNTIVASPSFVNATTGDFHLNSVSPGTNAGTVESVYDTFLSLYGLDIRKAADGVPRPAVGASSDLGAYQTTGTRGIGTPPAAPRSLRITSQ
jgi:hypothetical protein